MTPGARTQALIELIDNLLEAWQSPKRIPADKFLDRYFKSNRYAGSKDRAFIGELFYWILRHKASLEWWSARYNQEPTGRILVLSALALRRAYNKDFMQDSKYAPHALNKDEIYMVDSLLKESPEHKDMPAPVRLNYPNWCDKLLRRAFGDQFDDALHALNEQASTDLRVNTLKTSREKLQKALAKEGFETTPTETSPVGLRLNKRMPIFTSPLFKEGHFEVQDEGSQIVALMSDAEPGQKVIDFCAGAGGKTLAIAASMRNKGRILAWDISEKRLSQITKRLRRAGVDTVQSHVLTSEHDAFIKRHKQSADRVLIDAPCSGSGTWRRNPDLKWRFIPDDLDHILATQQAILLSASRLVKPGGRLIYATCSVFKEENEDQIETFLSNINKLNKNTCKFKVVCAKKIWDKDKSTDGYEGVSYLSLAPHANGVDGFFAAVLTCEKS